MVGGGGGVRGAGVGQIGFKTEKQFKGMCGKLLSLEILNMHGKVANHMI